MTITKIATFAIVIIIIATIITTTIVTILIIITTIITITIIIAAIPLAIISIITTVTITVITITIIIIIVAICRTIPNQLATQLGINFGLHTLKSVPFPLLTAPNSQGKPEEALSISLPKTVQEHFLFSN